MDRRFERAAEIVRPLIAAHPNPNFRRTRTRVLDLILRSYTGGQYLLSRPDGIELDITLLQSSRDWRVDSRLQIMRTAVVEFNRRYLIQDVIDNAPGAVDWTNFKEVISSQVVGYLEKEMIEGGLCGAWELDQCERRFIFLLRGGGGVLDRSSRDLKWNKHAELYQLRHM